MGRGYTYVLDWEMLLLNGRVLSMVIVRRYDVMCSHVFMVFIGKVLCA